MGFDLIKNQLTRVWYGKFIYFNHTFSLCFLSTLTLFFFTPEEREIGAKYMLQCCWSNRLCPCHSWHTVEEESCLLGVHPWKIQATRGNFSFHQTICCKVYKKTLHLKKKSLHLDYSVWNKSNQIESCLSFI